VSEVLVIDTPLIIIIIIIISSSSISIIITTAISYSALQGYLLRSAPSPTCVKQYSLKIEKNIAGGVEGVRQSDTGSHSTFQGQQQRRTPHAV